MELLSGRTLQEINEGALPVDVFLNLAIQIANGLNAVHSSGIVHRDIKPSNIHVSRNGCVKILDFGLAEFARESNTGFDSIEKDHEQMGAGPERACGTLPYMSPEQILGERLDPRADLFSFGVVLYQMLTGRRPFPGTTSAALLDAVLHRPIIPASVFRSDIPDGIEKMVGKALEKDPEFRCQSAAELLADLKRVQRDLIRFPRRVRTSVALPASPQPV
jgi:non-specific serine/threonine protein kinase